MDDKVLFQETAQKLIDYDKQNFLEYYRDDKYVKNAPTMKKFIILLLVAIGIYIYYRLNGIRAGVDAFPGEWIICLIVLVFMCRSHKKKMDACNEVLTRRKHIINSDERLGYVRILSELANNHPEWEVEPWWMIENGMELRLGEYYMYDLYYFSKDLLKKNQRGRFYIPKENLMADRYHGKEVKKMIDSGKYRHFHIKDEDYESNSNCKIVTLFLVSKPRSIWETIVVGNKYSSNEVDEMMADYSSSLDERERRRNAWEAGYITNEEKHFNRSYGGGYNVNEDVNDWYTRRKKEEKRRHELEHELEYEKIKVGDEYNFYQVGYLIYGINNAILTDVLLNLEYAQRRGFVVRENEAYEYKGFGEHCIVEDEYKFDEKYNKMEMPMVDVISNLESFNLGTMDYLSKRPEDIPLKEWAAWIYAHGN